MSLRQLPQINADIRADGISFDLRPAALARWTPEIRAASEDDATISILDPIGENWEGTGVTAKRIGAALRNIGARDVTVNVNSPGGDFFEGVAIYNMLREHQGKVTVRVMGLAASAASVIAMAGDELLMGDGAFLMIHNAWAMAIGNRHDMRAAADQLEPFDAAMAAVYANRTGMKTADVVKLMDAETWINSAQAVEDGWATGLVERADVAFDRAQSKAQKKTMAKLDALFAQAGCDRKERRELFREIYSSLPTAAGEPAMPTAGDDTAASLQILINSLKG